MSKNLANRSTDRQTTGLRTTGLRATSLWTSGLRALCLLAACSMLGSCAAPELDVKAMVRDWANYMQSDYVLRPNDQIAISVQPEGLEQTLVIPPTGRVNLKGIEEPLEAVGKPIRAFRATVQSEYRKVYRDDIIVQVSLVQTGVSSIYVAGEVNRPGAVNYVPSMSLTQAISAAGGWIYRAKLTDVRIIRQTVTGKPKTFRVNIDRVYHDEGYPEFLVLPGDVIYCQTVWIGEVADFLNLYIWSLLPFNQTSRVLTGGV